ncbi:MAG: nuclear transport factor 2 family protein [Ardenticatenaceae bacterium]|nr:nuclear transport factor 2 family protein [Ardenticatenaceae bacterium]
MEPKDVVLRFWETMGTNDFEAASRWLSEDFELIWPQSGELIRGRANFAALNTHYPAHGRWHFTINDLVAEGAKVVSDVSVTDGEMTARAITFSTVQDGKISRQVEFWPDPYDPPAWRAEWVELLK